ncbi:hypothetical protein [Paenibacillus pini]|nr:hypothetical protein [Paenibacillus pini]
MDYAQARTRRSMLNVKLISLLMTLIAILLSPTVMQMIISLVVGIVLTGLLWKVQQKMLPSETFRKLNQLMNSTAQNIRAGIELNRGTASAALKEDEKLTYEILREMATVVHNDRIRLQQVVLLQTFVLRKDMDLELEPLLLKDFDQELAAYIGEIAKIKRDMIKTKTIQYVLNYESHILMMPQGKQILASVVGACVRLKKYVDTYPDFIHRYAILLPKDRFLRLYQLVRRNPSSNWNGLRDEVSSIYHEKYRWDPDFQNWD